MMSIDSATSEMINAVSVTNSPKLGCGPVLAIRMPRETVSMGHYHRSLV